MVLLGRGEREAAMSWLGVVGLAAIVEHVALVCLVATAPYWGRAIIVRLLTGEPIWPWRWPWGQR